MILLAVFFAIALYFLVKADYLSLENIKFFVTTYQSYVNENLIMSSIMFLLVYITCVSLSIPGAVLLTLLAGALFGVTWGTVIVSFASSIGATIMFLISRYFFADIFRKKFVKFSENIDKHIKRDGPVYILTLRLIPTVPFFVINAVSGLTKIPTYKFYIFSQIGMLPGTLLYVNAGTQISKIEKLSDVTSPTLFMSFVALGVLPIIFKFVFNRAKGTKKGQ